jgi:hypothetical protein
MFGRDEMPLFEPNVDQFRKCVVLEKPCTLHSLEAAGTPITRASHYVQQIIGNSFDLVSTYIFQYLKNEMGRLHEVEFDFIGIPSSSQGVGVFLVFYLPMLLI